MGIAKKLTGLAKEFKNDPQGQWFKHFDTILRMHKTSGVPRQDVIDYMNKWIEAEDE